MTTTDARKRLVEDVARLEGRSQGCTELTCPHHGERNRALVEPPTKYGSTYLLTDEELAEIDLLNVAHNGEASRG